MSGRAQAMVDAARSLVGVRFKRMGRSAGGLDCGGLVVLSAAAAGVAIADASDYPFDGGGVIEPTLRLSMAEVGWSAARAGDVVTFYVGKHARYARHCAVLTEVGGIIHAHARMRSVVEHSTIPPELRNATSSAFRLPGG